MPRPPPAVVPCAATATGTDDCVSARMPPLITSASSVIVAPEFISAIARTSPPAQNAGPAASMRIAPTSAREVASVVTSAQA